MLIRRPEVVSRQAADEWLRRQAGRLVTSAGVVSATTTDVRTAMPALSCEWSWLVELRVANPDELEPLASEPAVVDFVGELQALGLQPAVIAVDGGS